MKTGRTDGFLIQTGGGLLSALLALAQDAREVRVDLVLRQADRLLWELKAYFSSLAWHRR